MRGRLARLPVYPVVLVLAFLVTELIEFWIPVGWLLRATIVLVAVTLAIQLAFSVIGGRDLGAYLAALLVIPAFDLRIGGLVLLIGIVPPLYGSLKVRRLDFDGSQVTRFVNVIAVLALVLSIGNAVGTGLGVAVAAAPEIPDRPVADSAEAPDIYLVLLDGYPRADTVQDALGYDNNQFLAEMTAMGFDVADGSHSNYRRTVLTLVSMLNAGHVNDLVPLPPDGVARQHAQFSSWLREPAAVNVARSFGYEFDVIPTAKSFVTPSDPDRLLDSGHLNEFEFLLPRGGWLGLVASRTQVDWQRTQHRQRIIDAFNTMAGLAAERGRGPKLVLTHVMTPHHPIIFRRDGSLASVPECYWDECALDPLDTSVRTGFAEQVEYTNELVRRAVEDVIARSPRPPVIIVFGDHGFRHWHSDKPETFQNLFMSYTPGNPGLFPKDTTLINVLPRVLNAYLGAGMPMATEDSWFDAEQNGYFPLVPWPGG